MKHKHHIIPRHAGGTDDSSNIIELTVEEHAEEHKEIMRKTHMGKPKSDEQRKKMSESAKLAWQKRKMFEEGGLVPR
jgi:hypothetical protein